MKKLTLREERRGVSKIFLLADPLMKEGQKPTININDGKLFCRNKTNSPFIT